MFAFFSNRLGCLGSIVVSVIGTLILFAVALPGTCTRAHHGGGVFQHYNAIVSPSKPWNENSTSLRNRVGR